MTHDLVVMIISAQRKGRVATYLCLGGDDVDLVDSPKRASVDAEGASDEQKSGGQLLQENHALSLVGAGHQNQDRAGSDGRAQFAAMTEEEKE